MALLALILICLALVFMVVFWRRKKKEALYRPPKLTPDATVNVIYGTVEKVSGWRVRVDFLRLGGGMW